VRARPGLDTTLSALGLFAAMTAACTPRPEAASPPPPMSFEPVVMPSPSPLPDPLPEVIATVNGRPIPLRHARIIVDQTLQGRTPTPGQKASAYRRAMEQLIARELLYQEAMERKIQPDAGAVERVRQQVRSEHRDEKEWTEFLAAQGLDPKSFVDELRVRNMVETMIRQETEKVPATIPDAEARAYYAANPNAFESGGRPLPFEDVRERIRFQLVTFKRQEALNSLLTGLRSAAKVEIFL
jgi:SurA-like protein